MAPATVEIADCRSGLRELSVIASDRDANLDFFDGTYLWKARQGCVKSRVAMQGCAESDHVCASDWCWGEICPSHLQGSLTVGDPPDAVG